VINYLVDLFQNPYVRRLDAAIHFLSGVNDKYHYLYLAKNAETKALADLKTSLIDVSGSIPRGFLINSLEESELFKDAQNQSYGLDESCSFNLIDDR